MLNTRVLVAIYHYSSLCYFFEP